MSNLKYFAVACKIPEEKTEEAFRQIKSLLINLGVKETDIKPNVDEIRRR